MTVPPSNPDAPPDETADPGPSRRRRLSVGTALVVVLIVSLTVMWAYALFGRPPVPGHLEESPFPARAQQICTEARGELDQVPRSISARTSQARADLVDRSTAILAAMVDHLAAAPTNESDRTTISEWLADWRTYLENRRDYAERLRHDPNARFYVSQSDRDNSQITAALDRLAQVNKMEACTVPDDVG